MWLDTWLDMWLDTCLNMWLDMWVDICLNMWLVMCLNMWLDMCEQCSKAQLDALNELDRLLENPHLILTTKIPTG